MSFHKRHDHLHGRRDIPDANHDRRGAPRYTVETLPILFGWRDAGGFHSCPGTVVDLSATGVMLHIDAAAVEGPRAWVRMIVGTDGNWTETDLLDARRLADGTTSVRLRFTEGMCPYGMFRAAVFGARSTPVAS
jgi:hypothetical protein